MAYFARLDNNIVQQVISISNNDAPDPAPSNSEPLGQAFIATNLKLSGIWKQTSYNGSFRKHYAGIGFTYDETLDAFIPPKPYQSWLLDTYTCNWYPPLPYPNDGNRYYWDEVTQQWVLIESP